MKKIKRTFLESSNIIEFKKKDNYLETIYFNSELLLNNRTRLTLFFNLSDLEIIKRLKITAIYIDKNKLLEKHENVKDIKPVFVEGRMNIPTNTIHLKEDSLFLWKLIFKNTGLNEKDIHFSVK